MEFPSPRIYLFFLFCTTTHHLQWNSWEIVHQSFFAGQFSSFAEEGSFGVCWAQMLRRAWGTAGFMLTSSSGWLINPAGLLQKSQLLFSVAGAWCQNFFADVSMFASLSDSQRTMRLFVQLKELSSQGESSSFVGRDFADLCLFVLYKILKFITVLWGHTYWFKTNQSYQSRV